MAKLEIKPWSVIKFEPNVDGRLRKAPQPYIANSSEPDTMVYLGAHEARHASEEAIKILTEVGIPAAVIVLAFQALPATRLGVDTVIRESPRAALKQFNQEADRPEDTPLHIIGKSQGGGAAIITAAEAPELFGDLSLLAPFTLNNRHLGDTEDQRRIEFYKRFGIKNLLHSDQSLFKRGNLRGGLEIASGFAGDLWGRRRASDTAPATPINLRLKTKVNYAVEDRTGILAGVLLGHRSRIFVGEEDPIVPRLEIVQSLKEAGLTDKHIETRLEVLHGSHPSILTRRGGAHFRRAAEWRIETPTAA